MRRQTPAVGYSIVLLIALLSVGCARNTYGPYQGYPAYPTGPYPTGPYPTGAGVPIQPTGVPTGAPGVVYGAPIGQPNAANQPVLPNTPIVPGQPAYPSYPTTGVPQPYPGYAPAYYAAPPVDKSRPLIGS